MTYLKKTCTLDAAGDLAFILADNSDISSNKPGSVSMSAHCNWIGIKTCNLNKSSIWNQMKNKEKLKSTSGTDMNCGKYCL